MVDFKIYYKVLYNSMKCCVICKFPVFHLFLNFFYDSSSFTYSSRVDCSFPKVKTQQGVPSQPSNLEAVEVKSTSMKLTWDQPDFAGENILSYELYWNDTYTATVSTIFKGVG